MALTFGPFSHTRPSRRMASLSHCTTSYSVGPPVRPGPRRLPGRSRRPISFQPSARIASMACCAAPWLATCSSLRTASNRLTRSAELTICLPSPRKNSTVPASTIETYMMALLGEYCIAIRRASKSTASSPAASSCQLEYIPLAPGSASSRPCSMRCTSLRGSPSAGT